METLDLRDIVLFRSEITVWSGKQRLNRDELGIDLPDEVFDLGTKRVIDRKYLNPFEALRKRAERTLKLYGTRFLGAWMVPGDRADELSEELTEIGASFDALKDEFLSHVQDYLAEWRESHPEWADILSQVPSRLDNRFQFSWQAFQIAPDNHMGVEEACQNVPRTFLREIAESEELKQVWDRIYAKSEVKVRSIRPLKKLARKIASFGFLDASIAAIGLDLESCMSSIPWDDSGELVDDKVLGEIRKLLAILQNPQTASRYSDAVRGQLDPWSQQAEEPDVEEGQDNDTVVVPQPQPAFAVPQEWF